MKGRIHNRDVSLEVMTEEFYDAAAFLRDLPVGKFPPRVTAVSITLDFPGAYEDEHGVHDAVIRGYLDRLPDGSLTMNMTEVQATIDPELLEQKRPRP